MSMNVRNEIRLLTEVLDISEQQLAAELGLSFETLNSWKNSRKDVEPANVERIYDYAWDKGIRFNRIYEQLLKEEYTGVNEAVLFHGTRRSFALPVDIEQHSRLTNDFGKGFYLGESFEQSSAYIAASGGSVLAFRLNLDGLVIRRFEVSCDWILAVALHRGWLSGYSDTPALKRIRSLIAQADVIIAPIADNRMFDLINEFTDGYLTDLQCQHALAATALGSQYVLKTAKALDNLQLLKEMRVSPHEREACIKARLELERGELHKVRASRIEYRGQGRYIEEVLK